MWGFFPAFCLAGCQDEFPEGGNGHREPLALAKVVASCSGAEIRGADKFCGESSGAEHAPEAVTQKWGSRCL